MGDAAGEPSGVKLRSYQQEMWQASVDGNIIVAMDTGSGKTHVAIARILTALEQSESDKLVWFVSPSVALSNQQAQVLSENLPAYHVRSLTGNDGVEKWSDQGLWDAALAKVRVVVGTPAVLADALAHGFVRISRLSLLVLDEAHRATKGHPMNAIMQNFYHPAKKNGEEVPHILGLTASPVMSTKTKKGSLEQIESNLDSIARTPKEHRGELESYVNPPELEIVVYGEGHLDGLTNVEPYYSALYRAVSSYDFTKDPYILDLRQQDDERAQKELAKVLVKRKTYSSEQLRALELRARTIASQLGSSMAQWYIMSCIAKFREGTQAMSATTAFMPDLSVTERAHLNSIFDSIEEQARQTGLQTIADGHRISLKAKQLIRVLSQHADASVRGIVFVEQRVQVTAMVHLLNQFREITQTYRVASFVGTSASTNKKIAVADLVGIKDQQRDLDAFRSGEKTLMIATNVLEEGIDVAACNFVVCFDPPKNLVSFVQRRGRARKKGSKYFVFASEQDMQIGGQDWATLEKRMKEAYMVEGRQAAEHIEDDDLSELSYRVVSTGAYLTSENAKSHLYHFCSVGVSQVSNYIDLRPEIDLHETLGVNGKKQFTASIDLPAFVHPDVRHAKSSRAWSSETAAIKDAAFQAYTSLHRVGLVNDNLLPLIKDYGPKDGQQHLDQPSIIQVSEREVPWRQLWNCAKDEQTEWHSYALSINSQERCIVRAYMWVPRPLPIIGDFPLYWNEHDTYHATLQESDHRTKQPWEQEKPPHQRYTDIILRILHENRMTDALVDLPVLLSPVELHSTEEWLDASTARPEALSTNIPDGDPLDCGLVGLKGQPGRSFLFHGVHTAKTEDGPPVDVVSVTSFPKRRDFLHRVSKGNTAPAYSTSYSFPVSDCTISKLPARFALLSAFLPSILHRIDTALLASMLQMSQVKPIGLKSSSLLLEAISSPSASEGVDYNRLEFLGDTVLKHCTELQLMSQHTNWPEAYLTAEKDRVVRNGNLAEAALKVGLDKFVLSKPFTGSKWRPPSVREALSAELGTRDMSTKVLADVVEALIGASYVEGGLEKAFVCIRTLLPAENWSPLARCFDSLIEDIRPTKYVDRDLLERLVGYKFQRSTLLVEAITSASFSNNRDGLSYERLEFLGDSVLDMIITPQLFAHRRKLKHWELHRLHEALVNSHILGFVCMRHFLEEEISDVKKDGADYVPTSTSRRVHLHDFLRIGQGLLQPRQKAIATFDSLQDNISALLKTSSSWPWCELMALNLPKFFSDMVESVLGALYIDTRGDLSVCQSFVQKLGLLDIMDHILEDNVECINPKERLGMVADQALVKYVTSRGEDESVECLVNVGDEEVVKLGGCGSKEEAEVKAAHRACRILETRSGYGERAKKRKLEVVMAVSAEDDADMAMDLDD